MDPYDQEIILELQKNGRMAFTEIAKKLGVSEGTIRNRVSRLLADKVIQIVAMVDPSQVGFDAPAMIGVTVEPPQLESVAATISAFPEVSYLIMVSGEFDLFVEVLCRDREHLATFLNHKLRRVPGIVGTTIFMTLKTYKMAYGAQPMVSAHTLPSDLSDDRVAGAPRTE